MSQSALTIKPSTTLATAAKAKEMKKSGLDVISFTAGEPDFHTADHIKDCAISAIRENFTKYTASSGVIELRKAICRKLKQENNLDYEADQIVVTNGGKQALFNTICSLLNPLDEILIPSPSWLSYGQMASLVGATPVYIPTTRENNYKITASELVRAVSERSKVLLINSPSNPCGSVYSKEELEKIKDIALANNLWVISDEIYEHLNYTDEPHISIAQLGDAIKEKTIVINGFSKAFAMTGWRVGYSASCKKLATIMDGIQSHTTSNVCSVAQMAALKAYESESKAVLANMARVYQERRDVILERLKKMPHIKYNKPEGAFYFLIDITPCIGKSIHGVNISNASDFAAALLNEKLLAVIPCEDFQAPAAIRISFATDMENIQQGMTRLEEFLNELK